MRKERKEAIELIKEKEDKRDNSKAEERRK